MDQYPSFGSYTPAPQPPPGSNPQQLPRFQPPPMTVGAMGGAGMGGSARMGSIRGMMGSVATNRFNGVGASGVPAMGQRTGGGGVNPGMYSGINPVEAARQNPQPRPEYGPDQAALAGYMYGA